MGRIIILGVFVADTTYRAARLPRMGETVLGRSFALGPGGKGSNQAVACGRLGAEVHLVTKLGEDDFARLAAQVWDEAGVIAHAPRDPAQHTGAAFIFVEEGRGENAIIISPGAAAMLSAQDVDRASALFEGASVFLTQLEQPLEAAAHGLALARAKGVTTILNPAPAQVLSDELLGLCDILTPNETEVEALTGIAVRGPQEAERACAALVARGVRTPILTLGAAGAYLWGHGMVPAVSAGPVVETTGAGDAFNAGLATALAEGAPLPEAVGFGCAVAGLAVTRAGAANAMPTRAEVEGVRAHVQARA